MSHVKENVKLLQITRKTLVEIYTVRVSANTFSLAKMVIDNQVSLLGISPSERWSEESPAAANVVTALVSLHREQSASRGQRRAWQTIPADKWPLS